MSPPAPGMAPMKVPMRPPERMLGQIFLMVFQSGRTLVIFSLDFCSCSSPRIMRSTPAMTSETANRPIRVGMNWKPSSRPVCLVVMKRGMPLVGSRPTVQSSIPKKALMRPLATDLPEIATMTDRPKTASMNISPGPKFMAISATSGDRKVMTSAPMTPPQKDANIATDRALPA